jgi:hypothetical protein
MLVPVAPDGAPSSAEPGAATLERMRESNLSFAARKRDSASSRFRLAAAAATAGADCAGAGSSLRYPAAGSISSHAHPRPGPLLLWVSIAMRRRHRGRLLCSAAWRNATEARGSISSRRRAATLPAGTRHLGPARNGRFLRHHAAAQPPLTGWCQPAIGAIVYIPSYWPAAVHCEAPNSFDTQPPCCRPAELRPGSLRAVTAARIGGD